MANKQFQQFVQGQASAGTLGGTEVLPLVKASVTVQSTTSAVATLVTTGNNTWSGTNAFNGNGTNTTTTIQGGSGDTISSSSLFRVQGSANTGFAYIAADANGSRLTFGSNGSGLGLRIDSSTVVLGSNSTLCWTSGDTNASQDTLIMRASAASVQFGAVDAASPVAQNLKVQSVVGGTSNTAGTDWTFKGSIGTGTGAGGKIIFQTAPASTSNTTQNALATALTLSAPGNTMQPSVIVGNQALSTSATDGFLYITTCAGTPTGVPTSFTGRVALCYDTTNNKFYVYNGAWKGGTAPGAWS